MKRMLSCLFLIPALLCALLLSACGKTASIAERIKELSGLELSDSAVISSEDTHGGFHGDGALTVVYDCSQSIDSVLRQTDSWHRMPLSKNLHRMLYDDYGLAKQYDIPTVERGRYFFIDRQAETDIHSDSNLLARPSFNFTLLILDTDRGQLCFFEFDT